MTQMMIGYEDNLEYSESIQSILIMKVSLKMAFTQNMHHKKLLEQPESHMICSDARSGYKVFRRAADSSLNSKNCSGYEGRCVFGEQWKKMLMKTLSLVISSNLSMIYDSQVWVTVDI